MISASDEVKRDVSANGTHTQSPQSAGLHLMRSVADKMSSVNADSQDYLMHDPEWLRELDCPDGRHLLDQVYDLENLPYPKSTYEHESYLNSWEYAHDLRRAAYRVLGGEGPISDAATLVFFKPDYAVSYRQVYRPTKGKRQQKKQERPQPNVDVYEEYSPDLPTPAYWSSFVQLQDQSGRVPTFPTDAEAKKRRAPGPSLVKATLATFDPLCARVIAAAIGAVKFDPEPVKVQDDGGNERTIVNPDNFQYRFDRGDGVLIELTDGVLRHLLRGMMPRLSSRSYADAVDLIHTSVKPAKLVDEMRYLPVAGGKKLVDLTKQPGDKDLVIDCPEGLIAINPLPLDYDPDIYDEYGHRLMVALANHDPQTLRLMCQAFGTGLTRSENPLVYCEGDTISKNGRDNANGKSTMFMILALILGDYNYNNIGAERLTDRFSLPELRDKLANFDSDITSELFNRGLISILKKLSAGGDGVVGEKKYVQKLEKFRPVATMFFASNTPMAITTRDNNGALDRRVVSVPFLNYFGEGSPERDEDLVKHVMTSKRSLMYIQRLLIEGILDLKATGKFVKTDFSEKLDLQRRIENNLVAQFLVNNDIPLARDMFPGKEPCAALKDIVACDSDLVARDRKLRGDVGKFDPDCVRCDTVKAWWNVFQGWMDEQGNIGKIGQSTFTSSLMELLGLDEMSTSWTYYDDKGKRHRGQGRVFVSKPDYEKYATGLDFPALDAKGVKAHADQVRADEIAEEIEEYGDYRVDVRSEVDKLRPNRCLKPGYAFAGAELPVFKAFEHVKRADGSVPLHGPMVFGKRFALHELCGQHLPTEERPEACACVDSLRGLRDACGTYLDFRRDETNALLLWETAPSYVRALAEAVAEAAVDDAPAPTGPLSAMTTPEGEATRLAGIAETARTCVIELANRVCVRNPQDEDAAAYRALIVTMLEREVAWLDEVLRDEGDVQAAVDDASLYGSMSNKDDSYGERVVPEVRRLRYLARVSSGACDNILTLDDVLERADETNGGCVVNEE